MPKDYQEVERIVEEFDDMIAGFWGEKSSIYEALSGKYNDWLRTTLTTYGNTRVEEIIQKIIDIEITKDNEDYELAQLRYREKVIQAIKK